MKTETTSVKKNLAYQAFYEVLVILLPLITSPYVSRVLGAENLGIFSYTYSIAYYFQLFGMLGIKFYGNRSIARVRDNKEQTNSVYSEILLVHIIFSVISTLIYIIYAVMVSEYTFFSILQTVMVIASLFDISWLFFGLEEFKTTTTRNTIIKVFSVIAIFVFVRDGSDLWKYILIMALSQLIGNLILFWMSRKYVKFTIPKFSNIVIHLKPILILFIPVISTSLFKYMDKIMLGALGSKIELGYYENAEKILNIPLSIILSFGSVMLPKMSNLIATDNKKAVDKYIFLSIKYMSCIAIAMSFGMAAVSINFAPIFWGEEFSASGLLIMVLSISLPFTTIANIVRNQDLIPNGKDKQYSLAIITGAVSNLIINYLLIPRLQSLGVSIGTVVSEFLVFAVQMFVVNKNINYKKYLLNACIFLIPGIIVFTVVVYVGQILGASIISLLIQILIGVIIYGGLITIYFAVTKDEEYVIIKNNILKKIKRR